MTSALKDSLIQSLLVLMQVEPERSECCLLCGALCEVHVP